MHDSCCEKLPVQSERVRRELENGRIGFLPKRDWSARAIFDVIRRTRAQLAGSDMARQV